jgi:hypothetical protein
LTHGPAVTNPFASVGDRIVAEMATPLSPENENSPSVIGAAGDSITVPEVQHEMLTTERFTTVNENSSCP